MRSAADKLAEQVKSDKVRLQKLTESQQTVAERARARHRQFIADIRRAEDTLEGVKESR